VKEGRHDYGRLGFELSGSLTKFLREDLGCFLGEMCGEAAHFPQKTKPGIK
jgi:hypothetical protein